MNAEPKSVTTTVEVVVFEIDSQRFGVTSDCVRELVRAVAITALPGAPVGVDGVIDVRGSIVPVFDLRPRLALSAAAVRASEQFLLCSVEALGLVALRADRVVEIRQVADVPLPTGSTRDALVTSLVRLPDGVVVLCDLGAVLSGSDFERLVRAMEQLAS